MEIVKIARSASFYEKNDLTSSVSRHLSSLADNHITAIPSEIGLVTKLKEVLLGELNDFVYTAHRNNDSFACRILTS
jgi:hypothetical protein